MSHRFVFSLISYEHSLNNMIPQSKYASIDADIKKLFFIILTIPSTNPTPNYHFDTNIQKSFDQDR
jgi:hypothetical protein